MFVDGPYPLDRGLRALPVGCGERGRGLGEGGCEVRAEGARFVAHGWYRVDREKEACDQDRHRAADGRVFEPLEG